MFLEGVSSSTLRIVYRMFMKVLHVARTYASGSWQGRLRETFLPLPLG